MNFDKFPLLARYKDLEKFLAICDTKLRYLEI